MLLPKIPFTASGERKDIVITRNKVIYALIITLALFCFLKIHTTGKAQKEVVNSTTSLLLSQIKDINDTESFNKFFTVGSFCGWQIKRTGLPSIGSPDYEKTSEDGYLMTRDFEIAGIKQQFELCISAYNAIDASVNRQFIIVVIITSIIIILMNVKPDPNNNDQKTV